MQLSTLATIQIPRPRDEVFDVAVDSETFPRVMKPLGMIPGVVRVALPEGVALATGVRREVSLSDGTTMVEEVLALDRPSRHRYRWASSLRPPLSLLVRAGEGDWSFFATEGATRIEWRYTFELTTPLVYPVASVVVWQFRRWMERSLEAFRAEMVRSR